jgi:beta-galactosidase/beta-glucuronidase
MELNVTDNANPPALAVPALHPRPQMARERWRLLDGLWDFAFETGEQYRHPSQVVFDRAIRVPFPPESQASGIGDTGFHSIVWYRRRFRIDPSERNGRLLVHFGAVDYAATVWCNGRHITEHVGGHTPFYADITDALGESQGDEVELVVRAQDDPQDLAKPRGKQDWLEQPHEIWYPRTTGIWQSVWLEPVPPLRIESLRWTPHVENWQLGIEVGLCGSGPILPGCELHVRLYHGSDLLVEDRYCITHAELARRIALSDPGIDDYRNRLLWSPENPVLISAEVELWRGEQRLDALRSYTALRSVGARGSRFMLNGRPYYLRMVLDQGYWPNTLLAPPSAEALRRDVELAKELGFNAVRKHQKLEDPRWLYYCDLLGLMVWTEMPSCYRFTTTAVERLVTELMEVLRRDYSHPCIVAWVPLNESWGVPDLPINPAHRDYVRTLYHLTKTLDPTRLVIGNDGWENFATDFITIHDYAAHPEILLARYATPESVAMVLQRQQPGGRSLTVDGFTVGHHPVILSEFGGIYFSRLEGAGWGYRRAADEADFLSSYSQILEALHECRGLAGFCYTQLTDTFQERNGLLNADRTPKVGIDEIARATRGRRNAFAMDVNPDLPVFETKSWQHRRSKSKE